MWALNLPTHLAIQVHLGQIKANKTMLTRLLWLLHLHLHMMILRSVISTQISVWDFINLLFLLWKIWHALFLPLLFPAGPTAALNGIHCLTAPKDAERNDWRTQKRHLDRPLSFTHWGRYFKLTTKKMSVCVRILWKVASICRISSARSLPR